MSDVIIKYGDYAHANILHVFLDGMEQRGVQEINLTQGTLVRGYRGEPGPNQITSSMGYVWDSSTEDFVLETVKGDVLITWKDKDMARKWLTHNDS